AYKRVTGRDIDERIAAAQAAGDHGTVAQLQQIRATERRVLIERMKVLLEFGVRLPKALAWTTGLTLALAMVAAIVAQILPGGTDFVGVWTTLAEIAETSWEWIVTIAQWSPVAAGAVLAGALIKAYNNRRRAGQVPASLAAPVSKSELVNITPHAVVMALRNLGLADLRKWIDGADEAQRAGMLSSITRYGPGAQVQVTLPYGSVTATDVMARRNKLAGNLDRGQHEVYIERDESSEREFTLWVADSGALDRPVPPSPLLDEDFGPVDIYRDRMPWGISPKGDPVELNLLQQHFLLAGLSKQGKTASARALALWAALDPSVRFRIADLKGFGDWSMFAAIADELIEGAGDANFVATCDMLEEGVAEMERRYEAWRAMGMKGDVTREHSLPGSGFEQLILIIDEVQKLYGCITQHPEGGDIGGKGKKSRAVRAAQAIHDQGRAVNIHLWQFAQNPTDANLPVVVREGAMIRASLFVGTESIARMALGDAPVSTGAAPHSLRAGRDRGTVVLAPGESMDLPNGATHTTVRTHFISTEDAYRIAERAQRLRSEVQASGSTSDEERDLLADVLAVLGDSEEAHATEVVKGLAAQWPRFYRGWDRSTLVRMLAERGVKVPSTRNRWPVRRRDVVTAQQAADMSGSDE